MRSLTVDECSVVSGGLLQKPFGDIGAFEDGSSFGSILGPLAYLLDKQSGGKCVTVTTDSNGYQTVNIIANCSGALSSSSDHGSGDWIRNTFLLFGAAGMAGGAYFGGSIAAGHLTGAGVLAPLLMAEGVYAGGMLGLTVGLAGAAVAVVVVGGIIYYVNYSSAGN